MNQLGRYPRQLSLPLDRGLPSSSHCTLPHPKLYSEANESVRVTLNMVLFIFFKVKQIILKNQQYNYE